MSYVYKGKEFYVKVPITTTADIFRNEITTSLKNKHRTFIPVIINSIRVIDSNDSLSE